MKDFKRMYIIKNGESSGWTGSRHTSFIITVEGDALSVTKKSGRDMYPSEINTCFGRFLLEYEQEYGEKVPLSVRRNPYRFAYKSGISGCQTTYIEIDLRDGFPQREFLFHQSCFGKTEGIRRIWVYDYLDLCLAEGFLSLERGENGGHYYKYDPEKDENASLEAISVKPRFTEYEEGWNLHRRRWLGVSPVVPLRVCRECETES